MRTKVLLVGEVCTDEFVYCKADRLSPEAPVPVLNPIKTVSNSGMSGNVYQNLMALDPELSITHIYQNNQIIKRRFIEEKSNHMFIRFDEGEDIVKSFDMELINDEYDMVIVSDYNKGFLTDEHLFQLSEISNLSIIDSKRKLNPMIAQKFTFVKVNEQEYKNNQQLSFLENIIITLGRSGAKYNNLDIPSPDPKETIDVSGAGDTFVASFILKYYRTEDIYNSILFANEVCSEVVGKRGVTVPSEKYRF